MMAMPLISGQLSLHSWRVGHIAQVHRPAMSGTQHDAWMVTSQPREAGHCLQQHGSFADRLIEESVTIPDWIFEA